MLKAEALNLVAEKVAACAKCPALCEYRTQNSYRVVFGRGNPDAPLLVLGEAPGEQEAISGQPFVGPAGRLLDRLLGDLGLQRHSYITNTIKCRPPGNRDPEMQEEVNCKPYLDLQLEVMRPRVILAVGRVAAVNLLVPFHDLRREMKTMASFRGRVHDRNGVAVVATYHPSYALRNPAAEEDIRRDMAIIPSLLEGK